MDVNTGIAPCGSITIVTKDIVWDIVLLYNETG